MPDQFGKLTVTQIAWLVGAAKRIYALPQNLLTGRPHQGQAKRRLRHFELNGHLVPGGSAPAFPRQFDGTDSYTTDTGGTQFTVHDMLGIHRGRKRGAYSSPHDTGSRGIAEQRNGLWQIITMEPHALLIRGEVNMGSAGLDAGDAVITIDNVKIMNPVGAILAEGPVTQVVNLFGDAGDDGALVLAVWEDDIDDGGVGSGSGGSGSGGSGADGRWVSIGVTCPA